MSQTPSKRLKTDLSGRETDANLKNKSIKPSSGSESTSYERSTSQASRPEQSPKCRYSDPRRTPPALIHNSVANQVSVKSTPINNAQSQVSMPLVENTQSQVHPVSAANSVYAQVAGLTCNTTDIQHVIADGNLPGTNEKSPVLNLVHEFTPLHEPNGTAGPHSSTIDQSTELNSLPYQIQSATVLTEESNPGKPNTASPQLHCIKEGPPGSGSQGKRSLFDLLYFVQGLERPITFSGMVSPYGIGYEEEPWTHIPLLESLDRLRSISVPQEWVDAYISEHKEHSIVRWAASHRMVIDMFMPIILPENEKDRMHFQEDIHTLYQKHMPITMYLQAVELRNAIDKPGVGASHFVRILTIALCRSDAEHLIQLNQLNWWNWLEDLVKAKSMIEPLYTKMVTINARVASVMQFYDIPRLVFRNTPETDESGDVEDPKKEWTFAEKLKSCEIHFQCAGSDFIDHLGISREATTRDILIIFEYVRLALLSWKQALDQSIESVLAFYEAYYVPPKYHGPWKDCLLAEKAEIAAQIARYQEWKRIHEENLRLEEIARQKVIAFQEGLLEINKSTRRGWDVGSWVLSVPDVEHVPLPGGLSPSPVDSIPRSPHQCPTHNNINPTNNTSANLQNVNLSDNCFHRDSAETQIDQDCDRTITASPQPQDPYLTANNPFTYRNRQTQFFPSAVQADQTPPDSRFQFTENILHNNQVSGIMAHASVRPIYQ